MMRIGMILDTPFPPDYRVEKEALTLADQGHDVFLFCLDYKGQFREEQYKNFRLVHYPANTLTYKLSALAYTFPFYKWIMKSKIDDFIKRYKPDVLHIHDMVVASAAVSVARKHGIITVLDLHENRPASMTDYKHVKEFPGKWLINLSHWQRKQIDLMNEADRVVVVTPLARQEVLRDSRKRDNEVIAVPNTSTLSFADEALDKNILSSMDGTFNLLYIGDTSIRRGTADAIHAIAALKQKITNIRLWMIGTSSADSQLHALVKGLDLEQYIKFEGWQPQKLFPSYITGSHICLSPLKRNLHHDTTFANKLFQYMSLERPVVVSDCPAQAELVITEKCGLVHQADHVEALAECIAALHSDEPLRKAFGTNAKKAVEERWHWEKTSAPLIALYNDSLLR